MMADQVAELEPKPTISGGRELASFRERKWREHLLQFSQVRNKVLVANPHVVAPFNLEEGKPSSLGIFVESAFERKPKNLPKDKYALEFWNQHQRSALLGRAIFADDEGRFWRDIDLKGVGFFTPQETRVTVETPGFNSGKHGKEWGLLNRDTALFDYQISEEFLNAGIRTSRVLAIIELEEIIAKARRLSRDQAIKSGIFEDDFWPVVEVRAFGTKARIGDLSKNTRGLPRLLLEDAKGLVAQELGMTEPPSTEAYLLWFAKTLGSNMGLMHRNKWYHGGLSTDHNITLDCRIVDLDSVGHLENDEKRENELSEAKYCLVRLAINASNLEKNNFKYDGDKANRFVEEFLESYKLAYSNKESAAA